MNLKCEITKYLIENLNLSSKKSFSSWKCAIWKNPRNNAKGSMMLTELGFNLLCQADFHCYDMFLVKKYGLLFDNKFLLWLDRNFEYPYYLNYKRIYFFNQRPAVEFALFGGDLYRYFLANKRFNEKIKNC